MNFKGTLYCLIQLKGNGTSASLEVYKCPRSLHVPLKTKDLTVGIKHFETPLNKGGFLSVYYNVLKTLTATLTSNSGFFFFAMKT